MLQKAIKDLRGDAVYARDGAIGAVDDLYFDADCGKVRYLVIESGDGAARRSLLVSMGCVAKAPLTRDWVSVDLSLQQLELGAGVWPLEAALDWLEPARVCSGRHLVGQRVEARDGTAGRVADLLLDDQAWFVDYVILDTGSRHVLVPLDWVSCFDIEEGQVRIDRTREELRSSPQL